MMNIENVLSNIIIKFDSQMGLPNQYWVEFKYKNYVMKIEGSPLYKRVFNRNLDYITDARGLAKFYFQETLSEHSLEKYLNVFVEECLADARNYQGLLVETLGDAILGEPNSLIEYQNNFDVEHKPRPDIKIKDFKIYNLDKFLENNHFAYSSNDKVYTIKR